jgi:hypothetical protein
MASDMARPVMIDGVSRSLETVVHIVITYQSVLEPQTSGYSAKVDTEFATRMRANFES